MRQASSYNNPVPSSLYEVTALRPKLFSLALILFCTTVGFSLEPLPAEYLEKVDGTPDFCQGDHRFGQLPGNGAEVCAPAAVSNALVWLNQHGYPKLLNKPQPTMLDQAELIRLLCRDEFLGTDVKIGTPPKRVVSGIEAFLKHAGYGCHIEQMGWRSSVHRIGKIPDVNWMLKSCMGTSNVLINVGWYKSYQTRFHRLDGHWVTLVGFKEEHGHRVLLIHDPGPRGGIEKKTEPCQLVPLPALYSLETQSGELINGDGYYKLDGIHVKRGADLAIIDGAISFKPLAAPN